MQKGHLQLRMREIIKIILEIWLDFKINQVKIYAFLKGVSYTSSDASWVFLVSPDSDHSDSIDPERQRRVQWEIDVSKLFMLPY